MMSDKSPFLTIVTRCCRRPKMLSLCIRSVLAQTDRDIDHIFIVDEEQRGLLWANKQFDANRHRVDGEYVYMLDDDAVLLNDGFIAALRATVQKYDLPDVVLTRSLVVPRKRRGDDYIQSPLPHVWNLNWERGERPERFAGSANYVVKADVWKTHTDAYYEGMGERWKTGGDWFFMTRLIQSGARIVRLDMLTAKGLQRGMGRKFEDDCPPGWWKHIVARFGIEQVVPGDWRLRHYSKLRDRPTSRRRQTARQSVVSSSTPRQRRSKTR